MTDLFGNPDPVVPAPKPVPTPVSRALQAIPAPARVETAIRGIREVIREGKPREMQVTTIWNV